MHTCHKCGTSFEGKFCPECGERFEETTCPHCGASLPPTAKFCPECGFSTEPAPETAGPTPETAEAQAPQTTAWLPATPERNPRTEKLYRIFSFVPAALFALASLLGFFFALAPALTVNDVLFGSGSAAMGNVYQMGTASASAITAFCVFGVLFSGMGIAFSVVPQMKWLDLPRTRLSLSALFTLLGGAACFGLFASSCAAAADVAAADSNFSGGMGMVGVGAGIILLIVFSLLFLLAGSGTAAYRRYAAKRDPSLAEQERREREELAEKYRVKPVVFADETERAEYELRNLLRAKRTQIWYMPVLLLAPVFALLELFIGLFIKSIEQGIEFGIIMPGIEFGITIAGYLVAVIGSLCMRRVQINKQRIDTPERLHRKLHAWFLGIAIAYGILWGLAVIESILPIGSLFGILNYLGIGNLGLNSSYYYGGYGYSIGDLIRRIEINGFSYNTSTDIFFEATWIAFAAIRIIIWIYHFSIAIVSLKKLKKLKPYCEGPDALELSALATGIEAAPENRHSKILRFVPPVCVAVVYLIVALVPVCVFSTNIFTREKVSSIHRADSQIRVEQVLGKADMQEAGAWYWYTDEYLDLYRRSKSLEQQYESALAQGDMAKIEELTEKMEQLQEEVKTATYYYIVVTFDSQNTVSNVVVYHHYLSSDEYDNRVVYELVSSSAELSAYYFEFCRNT